MNITAVFIGKHFFLTNCNVFSVFSVLNSPWTQIQVMVTHTLHEPASPAMCLFLSHLVQKDISKHPG